MKIIEVRNTFKTCDFSRPRNLEINKILGLV